MFTWPATPPHRAAGRSARAAEMPTEVQLPPTEEDGFGLTGEVSKGVLWEDFARIDDRNPVRPECGLTDLGVAEEEH